MHSIHLADAKHPFGECRKGLIPRSLLRYKIDAPSACCGVVGLLGVDTPVREYTARIIGIVHRRNDVEDKLVATPEGISFTAKEITEAVRFQEQYYDSEVEVLL